MIWSMCNSEMFILIKNLDITSKLVLLILLILSVLCWTIFFYKLILFRIKNKEVASVISDLKMVKDQEKIRELSFHYKGTIAGYFLRQILEEIPYCKTNDGQINLEKMQTSMTALIDDVMQAQEQYLPILSISASISTLLGLFGTVWGLILAFIGISQQQTADIATVAPGIAAALITTLAGLMVAIPAVVMLGWLNMSLSEIEAKCIKLARCIMVIIIQ